MTKDRTCAALDKAAYIDAVLQVGADGDGERLARGIGHPAKALRRAFVGTSCVRLVGTAECAGHIHRPLRSAVEIELQSAVAQPLRGPAAVQPIGGNPIARLGLFRAVREVRRVKGLLQVAKIVEAAAGRGVAKGHAVVRLLDSEGHLANPPACALQDRRLHVAAERFDINLPLLAATVGQTRAVGANGAGADGIGERRPPHDRAVGCVPNLELALAVDPDIDRAGDLAGDRAGDQRAAVRT